jgi:hypothetical protein
MKAELFKSQIQDREFKMEEHHTRYLPGCPDRGQNKFERRNLSSAYHCIVLNTTKFMAEDMKDPARALVILGERSFGKNNIPSKEISS